MRYKYHTRTRDAHGRFEVIHGEAGTDSRSAEWMTWKKVLERCEYPGTKNYADYGGRGIRVCPEWINGVDGLSGFELFLLEVGRRPTPQHQIDRIDNSRGYEPGNVKWSTRYEQTRNKRNNQWVMVADKMMIVTDALAHIPNGKIHFSKAKKRYNLGIQEAYELVLRRYEERTRRGIKWTTVR